MKRICISCAFLALAGCGEGNISSDVAVAFESVSKLTFSISDTIGVLVGDTLFEFGSIPDVDFTHSGDIMVLDAMKAKISVYTPQGEFIQNIGGRGAGPGEFQYPTGFAELSDGRIVVSDFSGATVSFFNADHSFSHRLESFFPVPPVFPVAGMNGSYYAGSIDFRAEENSEIPEGDSFLGRYTDGSDPETILISHPLDISIGDDGDVNVDNVMVYWDTDSSGNVFWAVSDDSTYSVVGMTESGEEILRIEKNWERVEKSEEELQDEVFSEGLSRTDEGDATVNRNQIVDVYPYHPAISGLYLDESNRIWVQQGYTPIPTFEVYSDEGELLHEVTIPELAGVSQLGYCFKGGFLAFDISPEDYPKIYLLELH